MQNEQPLTRREALQTGTRTALSVGAAAAVVSATAAESAEKNPASKAAIKMDWRPTEFKKMVALGESTTAGGWSSSRDRCWVSQLGKIINDFQAQPMEVVNNGIGANVISTRSPCYPYSGKPAANERLDKHVIEHRPDLLIISYGLNDARGGTPLDLFATELEKIIERVRQELDPPPLILLLGPYFMTDFAAGNSRWFHGSLDKFREYNLRTEQVAVKNSCLFVDLLSAYGDATWMVHRDGIHANDLGHMIVATEIFQALAQNCSGLAKSTEAYYEKIPPWRDESTLQADYGFEGAGKFGPP